MCFHDGPGIRTTVFFKGCNLSCPWCANPENISVVPQEYKLNGQIGVYGTYYSENELLKEILKDQSFYGNNGGVTFSGGEPLLQLGKIENLLQVLKDKGINICVETALQVPYKSWEKIENYIDVYIIDIKLLVEEQCEEILGGNLNCYLNNVEIIHNNNKRMVFRVPLNKEYTLVEPNLAQIESFLGKYSDVPAEIFKTHNLGANKYESLGLHIPEFEEISDEEVDSIADRFGRKSYNVSINHI